MYSCMWILATELKMFNKLKSPSEGDLVSLGREKKTITSGKGGRDLGGKMEGVREWEERGTSSGIG